MKYLILLLFFSLNLNAQILKPSKDVEKYITSSTHQLNSKLFKGPAFQQPIVYIDYSPLHSQVAGLTREIGPGIFMIDLNPIYDFILLEKVLLHELAHVYQIYKGDLYRNEFGFVWKGEHYRFGTPYNLRPWELHAEAVVAEICK
jgi:hypothetical protein